MRGSEEHSGRKKKEGTKTRRQRGRYVLSLYTPIENVDISIIRKQKWYLF
jgi:hypothetical protein